MRVPPGVRGGAEAAWSARLGRIVRIASGAPVGGGCVSPTARVESESGDVAFLKWADGASRMFAAEAEALEALAAAGAVRVPEVLGSAAEAPAWLLLEWMEPGDGGAAAWRRLGAGLAALHRATAEAWGWPADNFIGSLPQENGWMARWPAFWRERRLLPQLRRAYASGHFSGADRRAFAALLDRLDGLLGEAAAADGPSLLHGDLWGGNVHMTTDAPALVDPSIYYGHREVDLAMSELFGGFRAEFHAAYREAWPLRPGYVEARRAVYQLYYLLVHVNLFGGSYVAGARAAVARVG